MVPFIACEVSFGQLVSELLPGVDVPDLDLGAKNICQTAQKNNLTLWVQGTRIRVRLLPLMIMLVTPSLISWNTTQLLSDKKSR